MEYTFYDDPDTAAIICCHITENKAPFCMYHMMKMMECGNSYAEKSMK